jgi:hypothetical protein
LQRAVDAGNHRFAWALAGELIVQVAAGSGFEIGHILKPLFMCNQKTEI